MNDTRPPPSALSDDVILSARQVSKKFCRNLKQSMGYGFRDLGRGLIGMPERTLRLRRNEFIAVDDVSFELRKGDMLGLVGANGSGKTTLLRLVTGIFPPDAGELAVRGRVGALIALGAGFHPHMTGRENVYLNGAVLGMTRREIEERFDEIIAFAEIGDFLEAPVATYSSGMRMRLGFAIAVHVQPDLLLVDEVLAVGDMSFQEKCMRKMDEIRASDRAVILVTHSLYRIESLCNRAIWLEHGRVVEDGPAPEVVRHYIDSQERILLASSRQTAAAAGGDKAESETEAPIVIQAVECLSPAGTPTEEVPFGADLRIRIRYRAGRRLDRPLFNLRILRSGRGVIEACMLVDGHGPDAIEGEGVVECLIPNLPLTPKVYDILVFVREEAGIVDVTPMRVYASFRVTDASIDRIPLRGPMAVNLMRQGSPVYVPREWRFYDAAGTLTGTLESSFR